MSITALPVVVGATTPVLRDKSRPVKNIDNKLQELIDQMGLTMRFQRGIGLAAPQIGKSIQLFLIEKQAFSDESSKFKFLKGELPTQAEYVAIINPSINIKTSTSNLAEEGCLSLPGQTGFVRRAKKLTLAGTDANGKPFKMQSKGLLARVIQHEYDHLQGTLICDKFVSSS